MSNPASSDDVEARWRPLTDTERPIVDTRLDDAWRKLRRLVPDLENRVEADPDLMDESIQITADAVIRLLKNPDGHTKGNVSVDDRARGWELGEAWAKGEIFFTQTELDSLTETGTTDTRPRAFSVMPS